MARGRRRGARRPVDAGTCPLGGTLCRTAGGCRAPRVGASIRSGRRAGRDDGRHPACPAALAASGRRRRCACHGRPLLRQHRRRGRRHTGDAVCSRARVRDRGHGAFRRGARHRRRRSGDGARRPPSFALTADGAGAADLSGRSSSERTPRPRALRDRRWRRAGLRGRLVRAARAVHEHSQLRLCGDAHHVSLRPRAGQLRLLVVRPAQSRSVARARRAAGRRRPERRRDRRAAGSVAARCANVCRDVGDARDGTRDHRDGRALRGGCRRRAARADDAAWRGVAGRCQGDRQCASRRKRHRRHPRVEHRRRDRGHPAHRICAGAVARTRARARLPGNRRSVARSGGNAARAAAASRVRSPLRSWPSRS